MRLEIIEKVPEVRNWLASNVNPETLAFPNADATWEFITRRWKEITPNDAEALLGEAMRPIPDDDPAATFKI
jgi:hypothetical protein